MRTQNIAEELTGIDLGDKRLDRRARSLLTDLYADPQSNINAANDGWTDTMGAYRFFKNPAVDAEERQKFENSWVQTELLFALYVEAVVDGIVPVDFRRKKEQFTTLPWICGRAVNFFEARNEQLFRKSLGGKELRRRENLGIMKKFTTVTPNAVDGRIVVSARAIRVYDK